MQGYILTLLDGGLEDESINKVYLKRAEKNINRMISIVEDLESISGLESGVLNLVIAKFDILDPYLDTKATACYEQQHKTITPIKGQKKTREKNA